MVVWSFIKSGSMLFSINQPFTKLTGKLIDWIGAVGLLQITLIMRKLWQPLSGSEQEWPVLSGWRRASCHFFGASLFFLQILDRWVFMAWSLLIRKKGAQGPTVRIVYERVIYVPFEPIFNIGLLYHMSSYGISNSFQPYLGPPLTCQPKCSV